MEVEERERGEIIKEWDNSGITTKVPNYVVYRGYIRAYEDGYADVFIDNAPSLGKLDVIKADYICSVSFDMRIKGYQFILEDIKKMSK